MNLFIAAQRVGHGGAIARERRWVENDPVEARNDLFMRLGEGLRLEPVKNISCLERTFGREAVGVGQALKLPRGDVVSFKDGAWRKNPLQRRDNHRLALIHAE